MLKTVEREVVGAVTGAEGGDAPDVFEAIYVSFMLTRSSVSSASVSPPRETRKAWTAYSRAI
jgi:hypothetical protein